MYGAIGRETVLTRLYIDQPNRLFKLPLLELVVRDVRRRHAQVSKHFRAGLDHHRWSAQIEFDSTDVRVVFESFREHHFVDESGASGPHVLVERSRERCAESKVGILGGEAFKEVDVKKFLTRTGALPERNTPASLLHL